MYCMWVWVSVGCVNAWSHLMLYILYSRVIVIITLILLKHIVGHDAVHWAVPLHALYQGSSSGRVLSGLRGWILALKPDGGSLPLLHCNYTTCRRRNIFHSLLTFKARYWYKFPHLSTNLCSCIFSQCSNICSHKCCVS